MRSEKLIDVGDEDYNRVMAGLDDAQAIIAALDDEAEDAADAAVYAERMADLKAERDG